VVIIGKRLIFSLLVFILLFSSGLVGCTGEPTTQEIVDKSIAAGSELSSYTFDMEIDMTMEGIPGNNPGNFVIKGNADGAMDISNNKMRTTMVMDVDIPGLGKQAVPVDYYLIDEWMYMKTDLPVVGPKWMKMQIDSGMMASQDQLTQQLEMLKNAVSVEVTGKEEIDNVSCYVIELNPDMEQISQWLNSLQQSTNMQSMDMSDIDLEKLIKSMSIKEWVDENSFMLMKADVEMFLSMSPEDFGADAQDMGQINMNINETIRIQNHNQPVEIVLPPEAQQAQAISSND